MDANLLYMFSFEYAPKGERISDQFYITSTF